jgi:hypothetical protein
MKKLLLFLAVSTLLLGCSAEEQGLDCYNSQYGYEQLDMDDDFIGTWYRTDNVSNVGNPVFKIESTKNNFKVFFDSGEIRDYCSAIAMGNSSETIYFQLTPTESLEMEGGGEFM